MQLLPATLHQKNYHAKTMLGVSDTSYYSTPEYSLCVHDKGLDVLGQYGCFKALP